MRISDWSSDVCSSDLIEVGLDELGKIARIADRLKSVAIGAQPRLFIFQDRGEIRNRLDAQCGPDGLIVEPGVFVRAAGCNRSEEHTSELQSLMRISYAVFCLKKKKNITYNNSSN